MPNEKEATAAHACSCGTSIICMAQMGAMSTVGGATAGTMGTMGIAAAGSIPLITVAFQAVGLGFLLALPALFYQTLLVIILAFTIVSSYFSFRFHRRLGPFVLAAISSLLIYSSIYLLVSEYLYWVGFVLMFVSGAWNYLVTKKPVSHSNGKLRTSPRAFLSYLNRCFTR